MHLDHGFNHLTLLCVFLSAILVNYVDAQLPQSGNAITSPVAGDIVFANQPFEIKWINVVGGSVDLDILDGPANSLRQVYTIATNLENTGSYLWNVPDLPPSTDYVIRISRDNNPNNNNYSDRFVVVNESGSTPSSSVRSTATTTSSTSSPQPSPSDSSSNIPSTTSDSSTSVSESRTSSSVSNTSSTSSSPPSRSSGSSTTTSRSETSDRVPATSSTTSLPSSQSSGPSTGVIVGAVIGGIALFIAGGLIALWIITRERRKRAAMIPPALPPPDPNNQSIWEGKNVYSYNPNKATPDIFPGQDDPSRSEGGGTAAPAP